MADQSRQKDSYILLSLKRDSFGWLYVCCSVASGAFCVFIPAACTLIHSAGKKVLSFPDLKYNINLIFQQINFFINQVKHVSNPGYQKKGCQL